MLKGVLLFSYVVDSLGPYLPKQADYLKFSSAWTVFFSASYKYSSLVIKDVDIQLVPWRDWG